jgi:23S rRNA (pseudouridine1915-N3)-methyltransferase
VKNKILTIGRGGCTWSDSAVQEYTKRLKHYGGVDETFLKPEPYRGDVDRVRQKEGERLTKALKPRDWLVVLDERGDELNTEAFTALVDRARQQGVHRMVWAIGGPYGHDPSVRKEAWKVVRLSALVLNHNVARVVLYEQLYRAMANLANVPYHH